MGSKMASASRVVQVKPGPLPRLGGREGGMVQMQQQRLGEAVAENTLLPRP